MRGVRLLLRFVGAGALAACASRGGGGADTTPITPDVVREPVQLEIAAPRERATELAMAAFVAEGVPVARWQSGIVESRPETVESATMESGEVTVVATVARLTDSTSQVRVGAIYRALGGLERTGAGRGSDPPPLTTAWDWQTMLEPFWRRAYRIAERLRR